jgi:transcription antitermination factor NusG
MHPSGNDYLAISGTMPLGWYAVYTRHQHEKSAAQFLTRKGFEVLLPLYRSEKRWSDRTQVALLPLFPNYLFVQAELERRVEVLRSPGVCWFVSNAGTPSAILPEEINIVRRLAGSPAALQPHPFLECGDEVRVIHGPLAGLSGILVRIKNAYRVVISIELLQKSAAVEVDLSSVERISLPPRPFTFRTEIHKC